MEKLECNVNLFWMRQLVTIMAKKNRNGFTVYVNNPTYERTYNGTWDKKTKTFSMEIVKGFGEGTVKKFNTKEFKDWCCDQMTQRGSEFQIRPTIEVA